MSSVKRASPPPPLSRPRSRMSPRKPASVITRPARKAAPGIGRASSKIIAKLSPHNVALDPGLIANWDQIAGEKFAKLCRPTRIYRDGRVRVLEVTARHGAAATHLQFHLTRLCEGVNSYLGGNHAGKAISRISISQQGRSGARRRSPKGSKIAAGNATYSTSSYAAQRREEARRREVAHPGKAEPIGIVETGTKDIKAGVADMDKLSGTARSRPSAKPRAPSLSSRMPPQLPPHIPPYEKGNLHNALSRLKILRRGAQGQKIGQ